jgi:hypothetical protein
MKHAFVGKVHHSADYLEGWVKLQEWFRPQLAFAQLSLNDLQDCGIGDVGSAMLRKLRM